MTDTGRETDLSENLGFGARLAANSSASAGPSQVCAVNGHLDIN